MPPTAILPGPAPAPRPEVRATARRPSLLRKKYVVPSEHGSWVWWLGPFAVGLIVGGSPHGGVPALFVAALAGFLLHQPAAVAVKALVGRYPPTDLRPALVWVAIFGAVGAVAVPCLLAHHQASVLWFVLPGAALFAWHLRLVARREERRQVPLSLVSAGALALAAPAAYVVAGGADPVEPWVLWALCWAHTASSITTVYLRLEQRASRIASGANAAVPAAGAMTRARWAVVGAHALALGVALAAGIVGRAPWLALAAFAVPAVDGALALTRPAIGVRPSRIGVHQLLVDAAFAALLATLWR